MRRRLFAFSYRASLPRHAVVDLETQAFQAVLALLERLRILRKLTWPSGELHIGSGGVIALDDSKTSAALDAFCSERWVFVGVEKRHRTKDRKRVHAAQKPKEIRSHIQASVL